MLLIQRYLFTVVYLLQENFLEEEMGEDKAEKETFIRSLCSFVELLPLHVYLKQREKMGKKLRVEYGIPPPAPQANICSNGAHLYAIHSLLQLRRRDSLSSLCGLPLVLLSSR